MARRKSILERKSLNKQEKETLREINKALKKKTSSSKKKKKKSLHITAKQYLEFLKSTAKANKKLEELSNKKGWLGGRSKLSPNLLNVKDEEQLERMLAKPDKVNSSTYEEDVNEWYKSQFVKNIEDAFGDTLGAEDLTYEQIEDLISRNPHLSFLLQYHRGKELSENLNLFSVMEEDIEQAIREEVDFYDDEDLW